MTDLVDVVVIGAGPAGVIAARRAAELGARTVLVSSGEVGGMAANDGPIPVRTLAHAARLLRETRKLGQFGIEVTEPVLNYPRLLARTREVVHDVREHSMGLEHLERAGVTIYEKTGRARFVDAHTIETGTKLRLRADKIILCAGGANRRLSVPGFEWTTTHSGAWNLTSVPPSMLVIGAGATGVQVASIFQAFGTRVELFEAGSRILKTEDEDVAAAVGAAFRESGMVVRENFGSIEWFEKTPTGVRMVFSKDGTRDSAEAELAVVAVGWVADTEGLNLAAAGVETDRRGYVRVDEYLRTTASHIFAAGDITGRLMLVPQAIQEGFVAAANAVVGATMKLDYQVSPTGSFTDPEYAQVGLTEAKAREAHDAVVALVHFDETARTIIDGQTAGFCKLIADRGTGKILGCHVIGERAVDIVQVVAIAMAGGLRVEDLGRIALSFPTYAGILGRAAYRAAQQIQSEFTQYGAPSGELDESGAGKVSAAGSSPP
jgi:pyruvate/2-oxoglutarate dehydrogenase complex dihydrolipoamide dehydrogenase (E3) component